MGWYAVSTRLLIETSQIEGISQVWLRLRRRRLTGLADDAAGGGRLQKLLQVQWYENLKICGKKLGYLVNGNKSWLIVKPEMEEKAKGLFGDRVNITAEGKRHLGAALGSADYRDEYSNKLVEDWTKQLTVLCEIAMTQPQAAYTAYVRGFNSKLTYFLRTIPEFGNTFTLYNACSKTSSYLPSSERSWFPHMSWKLFLYRSDTVALVSLMSR